MNAHDDETLEQARDWVASVRGFWVHAILYISVNSLLIAVDVVAGRGRDAVFGLDWAYWPVIFWGAYLLVDAITTFVTPTLFGDRWFERRIERYLARQHR